MRTFFLLTLILVSLSLYACEPKNSTTPGTAPSASRSQPAAVEVSRKDERKLRLFLVLLDFSKSYKDFEAVIQALISELDDLGPGDRFVLARILGEVDPKNFVLLDVSLKNPADQIFVPTKNLNEWRKNRRDLEIVWRRVSQSSKTVVTTLQSLRHANTGTKTDLHGAIPYSVSWADSQNAGEVTLIIATDLEHDMGSPTFAPPTTPIDVRNINVRLLFITYRNNAHWQKLETSWRNYFAGAASFDMLDSGRSVNAIFSPSLVPRELPSLLSTRPAN